MNTTDKIGRSRSGMSLVLGVVIMFVFIAIVLLAVDRGRVEVAKTQLQAAVDAAARYGVAGLPYGINAVKARVVAGASDNKVDGMTLAIDPETDVEFGKWNPDTRVFTPVTGAGLSTATAIRVTGRRASARSTGVPTLWASIFGWNTVDLRASAVAGFGQGADVVLIQDITTSFGEELEDAKRGDQALVDALYSNGDGRSRVAILVHTGWGKTLSSLASVGANYSYISNVISGIRIAGSPGMPAPSGTDIASGFDEALTVYSAPGYTAPAGGKTVVLVSDGAPTASSAGSHPTLNAAQLLTLAQQRADELWAKNVHIYVVFFDRDDDAAAAARVKTLIRGSGIFVKVSNPDDLPTELRDIVRKLPTQLVQ